MNVKKMADTSFNIQDEEVASFILTISLVNVVVGLML